MLIVIDALRADCAPGAADSAHLRSLGLKRPNLPAFNRLVDGAFSFSQAVACASYTPACHASLFTGLVPAEHGVRAFSVTSLSRDVRTLAEILVDAGYATCAMSDQPVFFQPQGLLRGFQLLVREEDEALSWWDSYAGRPRFLFMHLWDVHRPYGMPVGRAYRGDYPQIIEGWKARLRSRGLAVPSPNYLSLDERDRNQVSLMQQAWQKKCGFKAGVQDYIAGLQKFDGGRLDHLEGALRERGALEQAMMIVTADHGEGRDLPPSPLLRHHVSLTDDLIAIPLFLKLPGIPGAPLPGQVSQADITPTILDRLGLLGERSAPQSTCDGRSLLRATQGQTLPPRPAYAEISTIYHTAGAPAPTPEFDEVSEIGSDRHALIRYRVLRYPERKYWLVGKPGALTEEQLGAPADDLVTTLFHDVLGRPPADHEREGWLKQIAATPATDLRRRRAVVQRFEEDGEFKMLPKYAIFDLMRDPLELKPTDARRKPEDWAAFQAQAMIMAEMDRVARAGEPLVSNEADEQLILKRLQGLGYVE